MSDKTRPVGRVLCVALVGLLPFFAGCTLSAERQLIGRWYNTDMTIRFRPDGGVVLNTVSGKAIGRYYFDGSVRNAGSDHGQENLVLDVVRNGQRLRLGFEAEFVSADRLHLFDPNNRPRSNNGMGRPKSNLVLKRADENDSQLTM